MHLGWQESAKLYTMMFTDMKRFSLRLPFWEYLDNVLTCLMGDRHKGLKAAVVLCFTVALMMRAMPLMGNHASTNIEVPFLRTCRGHVLSNVRSKRHITAALSRDVWTPLVNELADAATLTKVDEALAEIKRHSEDLYVYIVKHSDYIQWVKYFAPVVHDLGQTTTNAVEIENARCKKLGIRSKSLCDIAPAIMNLVDCDILELSNVLHLQPFPIV